MGMQKKDQQTRVAIYTRVSTREQAKEGYSLGAQENTLRNHCKIRKWEVVKIYADEGISAKDIKNRPGMLQMIADAKTGMFDIVLVWKLSRFTRSLSNLSATCEDLERHNVALVSYSEAFDCSTASGRMLRNMLGSVAEFEREVISENVKLAMYERVRQGKPLCSQIIGYDKASKDLFVPNDQEAEYVRFVFRKYLERKCLIEVAELCRERGYRGKRGKLPTPQSILTILTRVFYCGYVTYHDQIFPGIHEALIDIITFNKVQALLKKQGKLVGRKRTNALIRL